MLVRANNMGVVRKLERERKYLPLTNAFAFE
jgi:hypothetical protein